MTGIPQVYWRLSGDVGEVSSSGPDGAAEVMNRLRPSARHGTFAVARLVPCLTNPARFTSSERPGWRHVGTPLPLTPNDLALTATGCAAVRRGAAVIGLSPTRRQLHHLHRGPRRHKPIRKKRRTNALDCESMPVPNGQ